MTSFYHLSQELRHLPDLASFPEAVIKYSDNSNLRKEGLFQLTVQIHSPALLGKSQRQVLEAGSDITPKVKDQRAAQEAMLASTEQAFSICVVQDPTPGMVHLHTSINISKTIPHRHAQRHISQVTLDFVTLTTLVIIGPQKHCQQSTKFSNA